MSKNKPKKPIEIKFISGTGELFADHGFEKELDRLVDIGLAVEVRFNGKSIYLANPYAIRNKDSIPNETLLRIFEGQNYCKRCECKHFDVFNNRKEFCDNCKYRIPINKEELEKDEFYNRINNDNFIDYFEIGEEPEINLVEQPMTYRQYLQTNYWKEFRQQAINHYGNKCNWCGINGEESTMNVHHIRYEEWFNENLDNVILLCGNCHSKAHGKSK